MATTGIFGEDDRVELIDGEIVTMTPIGSRHAGAVNRLLNLFLPLQAAQTTQLSIQNPIRLSEHSEPQPDLALLRSRLDFYASSHPRPQDVFLIVEVAETSAGSDRQIKLPLYAKAGIPEVWLIDLMAEQIEVFRDPGPTGYQITTTLLKGDIVVPLAFPTLTLPIDAILS
jgi:hypothetical protein